MSPATERFPALSRPWYWASLLLGVLLLNPQLRAGACPPSCPADKPQAATAPLVGGSSASRPHAGKTAPSPPLVEIDLVLVTVEGRQAREFARHLLKHTKQATRNRERQEGVFCGILNSPRDTRAFQEFVKELESQGLAKIMAEPRLVALSGRQVSFLDGGEQAVPVPAGLGGIGVQFEEFGTRLNFIPTVLDNGKIRLKVESEVSEPGRVAQRVRTTAEIEDGHTMILGGLVQHQVSATEERVPILGELPLVGAAVTNKSFQQKETELLFIITAHLTEPIDPQPPKSGPDQGRSSDEEFEQTLGRILTEERLGQVERQVKKLQKEIDDLYLAAHAIDATGFRFPQLLKLGFGIPQVSKLLKAIDDLHREVHSPQQTNP